MEKYHLSYLCLILTWKSSVGKENEGVTYRLHSFCQYQSNFANTGNVTSYVSASYDLLVTLLQCDQSQKPEIRRIFAKNSHIYSPDFQSPFFPPQFTPH